MEYCKECANQKYVMKTIGVLLWIEEENTIMNGYAIILIK